MKYCLFDGGDVVGPFTAQELLSRAGFGAQSLVCPEEHSDEESFWKEASYYEEFNFALTNNSSETKIEMAPSQQTEQFLKEMDTVMTELSSFSINDKDKNLSALPPTQDKQTPVTVVSSTVAADQTEKTVPLPKTENAENPVAESSRKISSLLIEASDNMKKEKTLLQEKTDKSSSTSFSLPSLNEEKKLALEEEPHVSPEKQPDPETEVVARTISKVSPLEEYFNTMKSGDLGNILGIPDSRENSDMNLSRALKNQFEKTEPGLADVAGAEDPFDAFVSTGKTEEIDESLFEPTPAEADKQTEERLKRDLPDLQSAQSLTVGGKSLAMIHDQGPEEETQKTEPPTLQEMIVPDQDDDPNDRTVKTILEGKLKVDTLRQEIPEPIKDVPVENSKPALATPLENATEEEEEFLQERVIKGKPESKIKFIGLFLGILVLGLGAYLNWTDEEPAAKEQTAQQTQAPVAQEKQSDLPSARQTIQAMASAQSADPATLAKEIAQQYLLSGRNTTVQQYLSTLYQKELQDGYTAVWSAERLHKGVYVVKYRLAKTRKEPIVYIFQVDTEKKKLTGALNNITLDLVGKIR